MIDLIIFSKNRPMQLAALLESIEKYCPSHFMIRVIYRATGDKYHKGYQILFDETRERYQNNEGIFATYRQENELNEALKDVLSVGCQPHLAFMVDDMIIYRPLGLTSEEICDIIQQDEKVACFSLRLGTNTVDQTYNKQGIQPKLIYEDKGGYIEWNRNLYHTWCNYNYPMSLDGHIFRSDKIKGMIGDAKFSTPNDLEVHLYGQSYEMPEKMCSFETSVAVNSPNNRVQEEYTNLYGMTNYLDEAVLNRKFIEGQRIQIDDIDYSNIKASHQELELIIS